MIISGGANRTQQAITGTLGIFSKAASAITADGSKRLKQTMTDVSDAWKEAMDDARARVKKGR